MYAEPGGFYGIRRQGAAIFSLGLSYGTCLGLNSATAYLVWVCFQSRHWLTEWWWVVYALCLTGIDTDTEKSS